MYHAAVRMTLNAGFPAEKGPPRNWGSFPPPAFGGLCRAPPGELPRGRRSLACASHRSVGVLARGCIYTATGTWSAGLRPASRGSAKPAPTTPRHANLTAANPRIANRAESRGHGAPVSDRHRAGARNPHRRHRAPPISRLERRSPTGIARERETRTDDTAPCQRECRTPSQHRMPRSLTAPLPAAVPLLTAPAKTPANKLRLARPSDGQGKRAATSP